jgi:hypothetical protein
MHAARSSISAQRLRALAVFVDPGPADRIDAIEGLADVAASGSV